MMAIGLNTSRTMNPMVNAGTIAASSLAPGSTADEEWAFIQEGLSKFAGRPLFPQRRLPLRGGHQPAKSRIAKLLG